MDSEDDLFDTIGETIDSNKLATSSSIIDTQNNSEVEFIVPSSNFAKEISKKDQNNQILNNDSNSDNTNPMELEDYDEMFSLVSNSNDIELETNEFEEIYAEVEQNLSNSFLKQLFNFDIEELTLESNEENISTNQIGIVYEWTLDEILNKNNA
ncbi:14130_t:CDS:2 [Gigaspora margarita]|uniref:14130_t:CDS:1 n=1 Tax=Gigaspora margarita TaxID=4874 RepID=A0ABN7UQH1_GIGMA|nr:14130_t:CDS:2 [Gigaspora margarita]